MRIVTATIVMLVALAAPAAAQLEDLPPPRMTGPASAATAAATTGARSFEGPGLIGGGGIGVIDASTAMHGNSDTRTGAGPAAELWLGTPIADHVAMLGFAETAGTKNVRLVGLGPMARWWPTDAVRGLYVEGRAGLAVLHRDSDFEYFATGGERGLKAYNEAGWMIGATVGYELFAGDRMSLDLRVGAQHAARGDDRQDLVHATLAFTLY